MSSDASRKSVLFVCLGNICRSPIAEAVFAHLVAERGMGSKWATDSAATSNWNIGRSPDQRGRDLMRQKNIPMSHEARQISRDDFHKFDFIFGMDEENLSNIRSLRPSDAKCAVDLLGSFDPKGETVIHDPYYGDEQDFITVYEQCLRCCKAFLDKSS